MSSARKSTARPSPARKTAANANSQSDVIREQRETIASLEKTVADLTQTVAQREQDLKDQRGIARLQSQITTHTTSSLRHRLKRAEGDIDELTRRVATLSGFRENREHDDAVREAVQAERDWHNRHKGAAQGVESAATAGEPRRATHGA